MWECEHVLVLTGRQVTLFFSSTCSWAGLGKTGLICSAGLCRFDVLQANLPFLFPLFPFPFSCLFPFPFPSFFSPFFFLPPFPFPYPVFSFLLIFSLLLSYLSSLSPFFPHILPFSHSFPFPCCLSLSLSPCFKISFFLPFSPSTFIFPFLFVSISL